MPAEQLSEPIVCVLSKASLDDNPAYDALSYVWGDPAVCDKITLDGRERDVTVNLFAALRRLRHATEQKHLWVDALCIDQENHDEKTHQVGLMGRIYSQAREVFLWLGDLVEDDDQEDSGGSEPATVAQDVSGRQAGMAARHRDFVLGLVFIVLLAQHGPGTTTCIRDALVDPDSNQGMLAFERGLRTIMGFSWWTRLWTVQEVVLSQNATLVCGNMWLPWQTLANAAINIRVNGRHCQHRCCAGLDRALVSRFCERVKSITDLAEAQSRPAGSLNIAPLTRFRDRVASDPRDRVYALLGVIGTARGAGEAGIMVPDYTLDHRSVYANAVVDIIRHSKKLDILWRPREYHRDPLLPSWVPDWLASTDPEILGMELNQFHNLSLDSSVGQPSIVVDYQPHHGALTLFGVKVDIVVRTFDAVIPETFADSAFLAGAHDILRKWERAMVNEPGQPYPRASGGGSYEEAFWRLMAGDHIILGSGADEIVGNADDVLMVISGATIIFATMATYRRMGPEEWQLIRDHVAFNNGSDSERQLPPLTECLVPQLLVNQRLFQTESGLLGLGPIETRVGDTVHVLLGGKCPFILRETTEQAGLFNLVGAGFVQGIMDGEAIPDGTVARAVTLV